MFPPFTITNITHLAVVKSFRNESFLRQEYLENGRSLNELAKLTLSSTKTLVRYLTQYQIPIKEHDRPCPIRQKPYGIEFVNGSLSPEPTETQTIHKMQKLRAEGHSFREIVQILNDLKIPCRKPGARWHLKTVYKVLATTG